MPDGREDQSPGALQLSEEVLRRRVWRPEADRRLRETTILRALPPYLKGDIAVDVGAATGHITHFLKDYYKKVWAFEAVPAVYEQLRKMASETVQTINLAIGDKSGNERFFVDDKRLSNSGFQDLGGGPSFITEVEPLDAFMYTFGEVGFIKVDVEGTELDVLRGAERIIARDRPNMMIEISEPYSKYPLESIFDLLMGQGYKCAFYSHPDLVEVHSPAEGLDAVLTRHKEHDGDFLFWT